MNRFILLLGSASGERIDAIIKGIELVKFETESVLIDNSSVFTELNNEGQKGIFVNAAALFRGATLPSKELLEHIEVLSGRDRNSEERHTHVLDIDLMMWEEKGFVFLGKDKYFVGGYPFFALNQIKKNALFEKEIDFLMGEKKIELDFLNKSFYHLLSKEKFNKLIKK